MQSDTNNPQPNPSTESRPESPNTVQNTAQGTQSQDTTDQYLDETYTGQLEVNSPAINGGGGITTASPDNMIGISIAFLIFAIVLLLSYKISRSSQKKTATKTVSQAESVASTASKTSDKKTTTKSKKTKSTSKKKKSTKKSSTKKKK